MNPILRAHLEDDGEKGGRENFRAVVALAVKGALVTHTPPAMNTSALSRLILPPALDGAPSGMACRKRLYTVLFDLVKGPMADYAFRGAPEVVKIMGKTKSIRRVYWQAPVPGSFPCPHCHRLITPDLGKATPIATALPPGSNTPEAADEPSVPAA